MTTTSQTTTDTGIDATATPQTTNGSLPADTSWTIEAKDYPNVNEGFISGYVDLAREMGLNGENANRMLKSTLALAEKADQAEFEQKTGTWLAQSQNDPEIGGEHFVENIRQANRAMDAYGSYELRQLLDETGLGNHPLIIRLFHNLSKTLKEDGVVKGTATAGGGKSLANRMFPNMN
jgi:hypothetical protein